MFNTYNNLCNFILRDANNDTILLIDLVGSMQKNREKVGKHQKCYQRQQYVNVLLLIIFSHILK